ncbi:rhodanese-like domain-containing protein [Otariodibacter sp.]|uniref:sulfurtransferase n=1 Tax=Otariodibacter sp. TaxID=3030919 RepID=UPI00261BDAD1|nr:rhodanese-like domain-containing protein [Otariodibacter sp.]
MLMKTISYKSFNELVNNPNYILVDSRNNYFFNGFKHKNITRGGHIPNAIQFNADWLAHITPSKFTTFAGDKGLDKSKILIIYDMDLLRATDLGKSLLLHGFRVLIFPYFLQYIESNRPLVIFPYFEYSISAEWLNNLLIGKEIEAIQTNNFMLFHVSWGKQESSEDYKIHIPTAYYFDTDWIESGPVWNLLPAEEIRQNLLDNGITQDKTIILYSTNQLAAYRIFWVLRWAGVNDVRVLDGNFSSWLSSGFEVEEEVNYPIREVEFGGDIPLNPHFNISTPKDILYHQQQGLKLVSNRSWDEYIGQTSGYTYISRKGEPIDAIWGFAGTDISNMNDYFSPDGTLRNPDEIFRLWEEQGIQKGDFLAFYCGTGWRATIAWFITQLAGWENTTVYDGSWNAWQMDENLPLKNENIQLQKPNARNNFK